MLNIVKLACGVSREQQKEGIDMTEQEEKEFKIKVLKFGLKWITIPCIVFGCMFTVFLIAASQVSEVSLTNDILLWALLTTVNYLVYRTNSKKILQLQAAPSPEQTQQDTLDELYGRTRK